MSKIMIHTTPTRIWYVIEHLYPSLLEQGVKHSDILIHNDAAGEGNLLSTLHSFTELTMCGSTWHLQDDIILAPDFNKARKYFDNSNKGGVICGFCSQYDDTCSGVVHVSKMWYSFPCIRIPNTYARGFIKFVNDEKNKEKYKVLIENNKYDDSLFKEYMIQKHKNDYVFNCKPNLCDHIDYLIGGSLISSRKEQIRSRYFEHQNLIDKLQQDLRS